MGLLCLSVLQEAVSERDAADAQPGRAPAHRGETGLAADEAAGRAQCSGGRSHPEAPRQGRRCPGPEAAPGASAGSRAEEIHGSGQGLHGCAL